MRKRVPDHTGRLYVDDADRGGLLGTWVRRAEVDALLDEMDDLQRLPQPLVGFIPQTYGDAIQAGWIKHGDCPSHEWDNRTSAANARWMLERAGFASPSITGTKS